MTGCHGSQPKWLAEVSANPGRQYWAHLVSLLALALTIPAILGLMHMLKSRRPALGHIGAGLALFGVVSLAVVVGTEFVVWQAAKAPCAVARRAARSGLCGARGRA